MPESEKMFESGKIPGCVQIFIPMRKVPCQPLRNRWRFLYVGDTDQNREEPVLFEILYSHSIAGLQDGICIDHETGGLRLSSSSNITWTSKTVLTLYAMETVLGLSLPESLRRNLIKWAQVKVRVTQQFQIRSLVTRVRLSEVCIIPVL